MLTASYTKCLLSRYVLFSWRSNSIYRNWNFVYWNSTYQWRNHNKVYPHDTFSRFSLWFSIKWALSIQTSGSTKIEPWKEIASKSIRNALNDVRRPFAIIEFYWFNPDTWPGDKDPKCSAFSFDPINQFVSHSIRNTFFFQKKFGSP